MSSSSGSPLPARPDLAQQKTLARELHRAFLAGDPEAVRRVRAVLPDKRDVALADAQFVAAREHGFVNWAALRRFIEERAAEPPAPPVERLRAALNRRDAAAARRLLERYPELRDTLDAPAFSFDSPAIVAFAGDASIVELLLEFGADPNRRSDWWAGGFHALHSATPETAVRLLAAGAAPDACAAAHLDRPDLLARMLADDPTRVHERGGDGQTPLHFARSRAVADMLLAAGADPDARDVDHRASPAEWMLERARGAGRYELARYLVQRGATADVFLAAALGMTAEARATVERDPSLLDRRVGSGEYGERPPSSFHIYFWTIGAGRTPLDVAAQFGQRETLDALLALATPAQRLLAAAGRGDAATAAAIAREHAGVVAALPAADQRALPDAAWHGDAAVVALLLDLGFDPRTPGHDSGTALHCAAWRGSPEITRLLLAHRDARELIAIRDAHYGTTPLVWCCHGSVHGDPARDHAGVAALLLEAGSRPVPSVGESSPPVEAVFRAWRGRPA